MTKCFSHINYEFRLCNYYVNLTGTNRIKKFSKRISDKETQKIWDQKLLLINCILLACFYVNCILKGDE